MQQTELLRTLRAVRRFAARPIPVPVLQDILEVARWTGSSKNNQPWELVVVRDRSLLKALSVCGPFAGHLAGAQLAIALVMKAGEPAGEFDEGRLAHGIMLAAWAHGVGSCIGSIYPAANQRGAHELLGVPEGMLVNTIISLGYPQDERALRLPENAPIPRGRKPLSRLVSWERYGRHVEEPAPERPT